MPSNDAALQWRFYAATNHIACNLARAAVASFAQNLARDHAPQKIRVNAVCPGGLLWPHRKTEEIAALIAFLALDEAACMCGSLVEITGGQAVA